VGRKLGGKVLSLREAVSRYVPDGATVVMGTCLESLIPFAAGHEIIRQGKRDLTLVGPISDVLFDQLIGAGCVARVVAAWVGNVSAGLGHAYRRATEQGVPRPVEVWDYSNFAVALGLLAAAWGVPYLPTRSLLGSDVPRREEAFRLSEDPWTGEKLLLVRAIQPDVAILAVQRSDPDGNAHLWGNLGVTEEAALASRHVVLLAEEVVDPEVIRSDPNRVVVPGFKVSAVVPCPGGCHPSPVPGYYRRDHAFYEEYHQATRTEEGFREWLAAWVLEVPDREAYLRRLGPRWDDLRRLQPAPAAPVDYAW
jgi:glutaconate CoA-transferase subunit A